MRISGTVSEEQRQLTDRLATASEAYYVKNLPLMTDEAFDKVVATTGINGTIVFDGCSLSLSEFGALMPVSQTGTANVISVHHERAGEGSDIIGCYLRIVLETRNFDHVREISNALKNAGFKLV
jgi:hypothetical protein